MFASTCRVEFLFSRCRFSTSDPPRFRVDIPRVRMTPCCEPLRCSFLLSGLRSVNGLPSLRGYTSLPNLRTEAISEILKEDARNCFCLFLSHAVFAKQNACVSHVTPSTMRQCVATFWGPQKQTGVM